MDMGGGGTPQLVVALVPYPDAGLGMRVGQRRALDSEDMQGETVKTRWVGESEHVDWADAGEGTRLADAAPAGSAPPPEPTRSMRRKAEPDSELRLRGTNEDLQGQELHPSGGESEIDAGSRTETDTRARCHRCMRRQLHNIAHWTSISYILQGTQYTVSGTQYRPMNSSPFTWGCLQRTKRGCDFGARQRYSSPTLPPTLQATFCDSRSAIPLRWSWRCPAGGPRWRPPR